MLTYLANGVDIKLLKKHSHQEHCSYFYAQVGLKPRAELAFYVGRIIITINV